MKRWDETIDKTLNLEQMLVYMLDLNLTTWNFGNLIANKILKNKRRQGRWRCLVAPNPYL